MCAYIFRHMENCVEPYIYKYTTVMCGSAIFRCKASCIPPTQVLHR